MMDYEIFSRIVLTIDYLLKLEESGRDVYPVLLSSKIALKREYPKLAEKFEEEQKNRGE